MGIGAYFSRFLEKNAIQNFLKIELILSVLGASSVILLKVLYLYFSISPYLFQFFYLFTTMLIGVFVGGELPLVATIYKELKIKTKSIISDLFTFDYIGGLVASLLFPLLLLPLLGLYNVSIFIGTLNLGVCIMYIQYMKKQKINLDKYYFIVGGIILYFLALLFFSSKFENFYLRQYYREPILEVHNSEYQNIVLTKRGEDFRMYLNGNIQFLSLDEARYHEALVDWPMKMLKNTGSPNGGLEVLVLGGGDGLAVRNLLKYENISEITLIDLDPKITDLAKNQKDLVALNQNSLHNNKVKIIHGDAFSYLQKIDQKYDMILADFPDPRDVGTAKLYSQEMYMGIERILKVEGIFVTQASNAFFSNKAFWSINKTINQVFGNSLAYHRYLPSFGDWGFVVAQKGGIQTEDICGDLGCTGFDEDYKISDEQDIKINTLSHPKIIEYYGEGYNKFNL
ncbi:MAG: hypothetical protein GY828_03320 [Candidatus Gracilibacteria bacterium]|nr:hypothetical protein [Candidatus Gracilibacteria bacterium]